MLKKIQKLTMAVAALGAVAVGSAVIANAASDGSATSVQSGQMQPVASDGTRSQAPQRQRETPLTGATADKVKAAALEKVPGGTVLRVETDADGSPYEAHVRKSNGTEVIVKVNKDFKATATEEGRGGRGGPGHGCHGDGKRGGGGSDGDSSGGGASSSTGWSSSSQI